jgi:hypothetical protein
MEELLKYAIEGGSFGISLFLTYVLFKKFIKKEVIEPIEELKSENVEIRKGFITFTNDINGFVFRLMKNHSEIIESVNKNSSNMNTILTDAISHSSTAKLESFEALKKVNVLETTTDKLLKISTLVHDKNKNLETEIIRISKDMFMVKNKIGIKNED